MKKTNWCLLIIGALLIDIPYFINVYSVFRLISLLLGIIVLTLGFVLNNRNKIFKIIIIPLILIGYSLGLDYLLSYTFKNIPVVSVRYKSSNKIKTYDSLFYRVYDCDGKLKFDDNYKADYMCSTKDINLISVNKFLENPKESYKKSKGEFVRLQGKINTIIGDNTLVLNSYDENIELNGYVVFDTNKKVVINNLKINPKDFYVYDVVEIVGLVSSIEVKAEETIINLSKAKIVKSELYDNYDLLVNDISDRTLVKFDEKRFYYGIEGIYYKYDENNIYEIDYLLSDKRETINNIIGNNSPISLEEEHELYELEQYNLVVCKTEEIIFANKDITNLKKVCDFKEN